MTAFISIAPAKPRTQRTAKGLNLSGAQGKHARRDGRRIRHEKYDGKKPEPSDSSVIAESLECGLFSSNTTKLTRTPAPRPAYTIESSGYACKPAKRGLVTTKMVQCHQQVLDTLRPQYDESGRRIFYVDAKYDAMSLCRRGRY